MMMMMTSWSIFALFSFIAPTFADSNGMISSMDVSMDLAVGNMLPYIHFTPGDTLWFLGWVPSSVGAMVGACIGVFLIAILERWLAACLALAEHHWAARASILVLERSDDVFSPSSEPSVPSVSLPRPGKLMWFRLPPPFVPEFDITRGILFSAHWFLKVLLMMAIMTFQLSFLLAVSIGSGVGETLFGRFSPSSHEH